MPPILALLFFLLSFRCIFSILLPNLILHLFQFLLNVRPRVLARPMNIPRLSSPQLIRVVFLFVFEFVIIFIFIVVILFVVVFYVVFILIFQTRLIFFLVAVFHIVCVAQLNMFARGVSSWVGVDKLWIALKRRSRIIAN